MIRLIALLTALLSAVAHAQTASSIVNIEHVPGTELSYDIIAQTPTENVDGTAIDDLAKLTLYSCQGEACTPNSFRQDYPTTEPGTEITMTRTFTPTGDLGTTQVVRYHATASDSEDPANESAPSNIKEYRILFVAEVIPPTVPGPPSLAPEGSSAFILVQSQDALVLLDIGTLNASTSCDPSTVVQDDNGVLAYKVPSSNVTPYNASQELVVTFARCGS